MSRCALGPKKLRKLEALIGVPVEAALVRGGWPHGWAEVYFANVPGLPSSWFINYWTGEWNTKACTSCWLKAVYAFQDAQGLVVEDASFLSFYWRREREEAARHGLGTPG